MPAYTNGVTNGLHPAVATHVNGVNRVNGVNGTHSTPAHPAFDSIPDAIEAFARGEFVIVLDSPSRENEGDLIGAASLMTPAKMAFIIRYTSGYLCAPIPDSTADRLELPLMIPRAKAQDPNRTAYTISIDAEHPDISTGISAADRALTCRTLADLAAVPSSFRRPGHILPLRAREGGVRARRGHTEAATDLCRLAGLPEAGILGEMILDGDVIPGKAEFNGAGMMRRDDCLAFGKQWDIKVITIEDMVTWLEENEGRLQAEGVDY